MPDSVKADAAATVLLVDDEPVNLQLLQGMLRHREGIQLLTAADGAEAVEQVRTRAIDLVLMDVLMPVMDGYEATRQIKALDGDSYVPVLFVTALNDDDQLARCVACGGDDFIAKPVNRVQLNARVDSWLRIAQVYRTVREQRDSLDAYQRRTEIDQWIAREVMQRATATPLLQGDGVRYCYWPAEILSGDMLLAAESPDGRAFFMLGDFTGHGIAASIGTVPTADLFHREVARGVDARELLASVNTKLHQYLPPNLFMAAALLVCDTARGCLEIWNGGMPDVLYRTDDGLLHRVESSHLPLGVQGHMDPFDMTRLEVSAGTFPDRVWILSDGAQEARNSDGEEYGQTRAEQALMAGGLARVEEELRAFQALAGDDVTMLEFRPEAAAEPAADVADRRVGSEWAFSMELDAAALRGPSPLQPIADGVAHLEKLTEEERQRFLTVLAELYSNALEHGVLGLDSALKASPDGFTEYYETRCRALDGLHSGFLRIQVGRGRDERGGLLRIRMTDSGAGFDHQRVLQGDACPDESLSGRGIKLLQGMCDSLCYYGRGNLVEARFRLAPRERDDRGAGED
ncbi:ATP-binding SpoIIE family protein phosphatase [Aquisalimonas asiatica]|uniref:ATP-binding SpoIIE family protein phosphatase n=1 Tax=Aquisalimonas asiatica TaxID=406100 RepID=UPI001495D45C|nr:fused response regulator/phosphatase [Aquisalimonas asiatica]